MSKRLTVRYVSNQSEEFAKIKLKVREQYHEDLFGKRKSFESSVTLVETMGEDKNVIGFTVDNPRRGSYATRVRHGYSLVTHRATYNRSKDQAVKWVKDQFKFKDGKFE